MKLVTEVWFTVVTLIIAALVFVLQPIPAKLVDYYFAAATVALSQSPQMSSGGGAGSDHFAHHTGLHGLLLQRWRRGKSS